VPTVCILSLELFKFRVCRDLHPACAQAGHMRGVLNVDEFRVCAGRPHARCAERGRVIAQPCRQSAVPLLIVRRSPIDGFTVMCLPCKHDFGARSLDMEFDVCSNSMPAWHAQRNKFRFLLACDLVTGREVHHVFA